LRVKRRSIPTKVMQTQYCGRKNHILKLYVEMADRILRNINCGKMWKLFFFSKNCFFSQSGEYAHREERTPMYVLYGCRFTGQCVNKLEEREIFNFHKLVFLGFHNPFGYLVFNLTLTVLKANKPCCMINYPFRFMLC